MSEIYTVKGKTVAEAMQSASNLYGGDGKELSFDIVAREKKGFLGLGGHDAEIRVTVSDSADSDLSSIVNEIKGYKQPETGYYSDKEETEKKAQKENNQDKPKTNKPAEKKNDNRRNDGRKPEEKKAPAPEKKQEKKAPAPAAALEDNYVPDMTERDDSETKIGVKPEEMEYAIEFINKIVAGMKLGATAVALDAPEGVEFIRENGDEVYPAINVIGDDTGILIGHHGETLDALQYLVNLSLYRRNGEKRGREHIRITVDIEGYREKRAETLRSLARRMAAKAVKYKKNVFLEPMNPYERRIIHAELQSFEGVSTHSVGADINRKIVITYEGSDKAAQSSNGGRGRGRGRYHGKKPSNRENNNAPTEVEELTTAPRAPLPSLDEE